MFQCTNKIVFFKSHTENQTKMCIFDKNQYKLTVKVKNLCSL